mgnify:FL=1
MTPIESFELDEGYDAAGVRTIIKFEGNQAVKVRSYDAEPLIEQCKAERIASAGMNWGEGRKVGSIPPHVYATFLQIKDQRERTKLIKNFLNINTHFVTFDRYLK